MSGENSYRPQGFFGLPMQQRGYFPRPCSSNSRGGFEMGFSYPMGWPPMPPEFVMGWMEHQHPVVLKQIVEYGSWLLTQNSSSQSSGIPKKKKKIQNNKKEENKNENKQDSKSSESDKPSNPPIMQQSTNSRPPPFVGNPFILYPKQSSMMIQPDLISKDNDRKIIVRKLPDMRLIPCPSKEYPEASSDRQKLASLEKNLYVLQKELNKLCKSYKIENINEDSLKSLSDDVQKKFKTAMDCLASAESTFTDFKLYLKDEKYKQFYENQIKENKEIVTSMIGEMPKFIPHSKTSFLANFEDDDDEEANEFEEISQNP